MTAPALCVVCARREPKTGLLCGPDLGRLGRHLDPANRGRPFDPDDPSAPVRPPSIAILYAELADLRPDLGESDHEHAEAASANEHHIALRDVRSKATGPEPDDDGLTGPPSVIATLGGWARIVHEEHLDLEGRPDPLPALARPAWIETRSERAGNIIRVPVATDRPDVQAVETLCRWLHARLEWLAAQPWVDEFVRDLRRLTAALNAGRGDPGARPLGRCKVEVDAYGQPWDDATSGVCGPLCPAEGCGEHVGPFACGEALFMPPLPPRAPDEPVTPPAMVCNRCGTRVSGLELLEYAREHGIEAEQS